MRAVFFIILLCCTSCGWRVADTYSKNNAHTLSIPYAYGDDNGLLTAEVIAQVQKETAFSYVREGGEYTLYVTLLDAKNQSIGFRYDPEKLKNGKKRIIPDEVRRELLAKVSVVHAASNQEVLGPEFIIGSTEFDHRYYNLSHDINNYSLGQLTDIDTTYDVVDVPLQRDLAIQIALWLENNADSLYK